MEKGNTSPHRSSQAGEANPDPATGAQGKTVDVSRVFEVLSDGLRTIDDAADLIRAALMDMDTGTRPHAHTGHHLNGVGKFISLKKIKDAARQRESKMKGDPLELPGKNRQLA